MLVAVTGNRFRGRAGIICTSFGLSAMHAPSATMFSTQQEHVLYTFSELYEDAMRV